MPAAVESSPDTPQIVVPLESGPQCLQPLNRRALVPGIVAAVLALAIMPFSESAFLSVRAALKWLPLSSLFSSAVQFASPPMLAIACFVIVKLDRKRSKLLIYLLLGIVMSCGTNDLIKEISGRARPEWSVGLNADRERELQSYVAQNPGSPVRVTTADQWLWFSAGRPHFSDKFTSFPSGHACGAFAVAAFLSVLYPETRLAWIIGAFCCALARVRFSRHFPDDVLFGGALGWAISVWVFSWRWPMRLADRMTRGNVGRTTAPSGGLQTHDKYGSTLEGHGNRPHH